jgi:antitoxin (DNA-binding transcriptional repressor) of toxin-antitoxin stability system
MRKVGLKILKNKLSEYVRLAAAGETIVVTDRGRAVAEIGPPQRPVGLTAFEERGVREGWLRPAQVRDGSPPPGRPMPGLTFERLMADLERDRSDW